MQLKPEDWQLAAIHLYTGQSRTKTNSFESCSCPELFLKRPELLQWEAHEIVSALGEPNEKGGGAARSNNANASPMSPSLPRFSQQPIWLQYDRLQLDLVGSDWDDRHNRISCITLT